MSQKRIQQIERRIDRIKRALLEIGPMRPGSLTRQYKDPQHHTGAYWQISYTRQMKSRTEYVRKEYVKEVRRLETHLLHHVGGSYSFPAGCSFEIGLVTRFLSA